MNAALVVTDQREVGAIVMDSANGNKQILEVHFLKIICKFFCSRV